MHRAGECPYFGFFPYHSVASLRRAEDYRSLGRRFPRLPCPSHCLSFTAGRYPGGLPGHCFLLDVPEVDESGLLWPARDGTFRILVANAVTQKSPIPRVEVATIIPYHVAYLE